MIREHYRLIKLQIELFDLNCYDFDVEELELDLFEIDNLIYNLEEYILNTNIEEVSKEEVDLLNEVEKNIKGYKEWL